MPSITRLTIALAASAALHALVIVGLAHHDEPVRKAPLRTRPTVKMQLIHWQAPPHAALRRSVRPQPPGPAADAALPLAPPVTAQTDASAPPDEGIGKRYFLTREVDYPTEFRDPVDFEPLLSFTPIVPQTVRVSILVNAQGGVDDVVWLSEDVQDVVQERFTPYLLAQTFRPAMLHGQPVASRIVLEFSIGTPSPNGDAPSGVADEKHVQEK
jgi:hypothetical protein